MARRRQPRSNLIMKCAWIAEGMPPSTLLIAMFMFARIGRIARAIPVQPIKATSACLMGSWDYCRA